MSGISYQVERLVAIHVLAVVSVPACLACDDVGTSGEV